MLKRNRTKRNQYGEVFVEGVACINALLKAKWKIISVAHDRARPLSSWGSDVILQANPDKVLRLSTALMEKLSDREDPSELVVIAERKVHQLADLAIDHRSVVLIFDRPSNHGNLGSLIRSCDAFGVTALVTTGHSVDNFDPVVMRASLGAFFTVPVVHCASPREMNGWITSVKNRIPEMRIIGTTAESEKVVSQVDLTGPLVIVLGNEADGMSRKLTEIVDESVAIPMKGMVDSLNVSCAGTVLLYEVSRQRASA